MLNKQFPAANPWPESSRIKWNDIKVNYQPMKGISVGNNYRYVFIQATAEISADGRAAETTFVGAAFAYKESDGRAFPLDLTFDTTDDCDQQQLERYDVDFLNGDIRGHHVIALNRNWASGCASDNEFRHWKETSLHAVNLGFKEIYRLKTYDLREVYTSYPESDAGYTSDVEYLSRTIDTAAAADSAFPDSGYRLAVYEVSQKHVCAPEIGKRRFVLAWNNRSGKLEEVSPGDSGR